MIEYVKRHTGIQADDEAKDFLEIALRAFAESLTWKEAERLAGELAAPASRWIMEAEHGRVCAPDELCRRVGQRAGLKRGLAVEWVPVALAALSHELSPEMRTWLERKLGDDWRPLLRARRRSAVQSSPQHPAGRDAVEPRTLAEGRPGSATPLSEARPSAQPDSVADENPYGDHKLSSADSVHADPLSSAKPRSRHPLSEKPEPK